MAHFLSVALAFPAVFYTVLLGVALVYWVFVMVGALHVNLLGEGIADAAAEGALDGVAKGALEGAAKGVLEGAAEHADAIEGSHGAGGIVAALKLRSAPATVVLSVVILFSWIFTVLGARAIEALLHGGLATGAELALLVVAPILALFPSSLVVRPLAKVFTPPAATRKQELVGKLCRIRTGTVTDRFGEAELDDGGAGLVVRVRVEAGEKLGRGDQAVILGYDEDRQEFTVAPLDYEEDGTGEKGRRAR